MNDYEVLLMLDPDLPDEKHEEVIARTRGLVENAGGAWEDAQAWGRRRLAYEIDGKSEGVYHLLTFRSSPEALTEVSRVLKITDGVIRHMATRRPKPHRRSPSATPHTRKPEEYAQAPAADVQGAAAPEGGE